MASRIGRLSGALLLASGALVAGTGPPAGALPALELGSGERLLVVAPHPDDESLCCGGLVQAVLAHGGAARIVTLSAGDGFVEAVRKETGEVTPLPPEFENYGELRIGELRNAVRVLGEGHVRVDDLGLPDGGLRTLLRDHWSRRDPDRSPTTKAEAAPYPDVLDPGLRYDGEDAVRLLHRISSLWKPTLIAVPDPDDAHPDHAATGYLALLALRPPTPGATEARDAAAPRILAYLIHWPSWPTEPAGTAEGETPLDLPEELRARGWERVALALTAEQTERKVAALAEHASQKRAMGAFFDLFHRGTEVFSVVGPAEAERTRQRVEDFVRVRP